MNFKSSFQQLVKNQDFVSAPAVVLALTFLASFPAQADDWPQWLGPKRDGVWRENGIIEKFPESGPKVLWRVPVNAGYCGPAVAQERLFVLDRLAGKMPERKRGDRSLPQVPGNERLLCLDVRTGAKVWEQTYDCPYRIDYPAGPRATPIVADGRVFTLGAMGDLRCVNAQTGESIWSVNFVTNLNADIPVWGWAAHPLLDGDRLICLVGGKDSAVVAFHKDSGKELWRALNAQEIGYAPPMIFTVGTKRQLIIWHPDAVAALEPETGRVLWTHPYPVEGKTQRPEVTIATPRFDGSRLFITQFYHGSLMLDLIADPPGAKILWTKEGEDALHTTMTTPALKNGLIYGLGGEGELRCVDALTGQSKWNTFAPVDGKKAMFATIFMVEQAGRYWIWNDHGELILANLGSTGYDEISRAKLLETQENTRGRDVIWCFPAFANRCAYVHNGKELICVSLSDSIPG